MRPGQRAMTLYRYDTLDRLVETEDALGGISKQIYDAEGHMMESLDARSVKTTKLNLARCIKARLPR
jgi:YD repeat-containing protein